MLYTVGRFLHFAGLLFWVSGFYTLEPLTKRKRAAGVDDEAEAKLLRQTRVVMHSGMGTALTGGVVMLASRPDLLRTQHWLHLKLALLVLLIAATVKLGRDSRNALKPPGGGSLVAHIVVGSIIVTILALAVFRPF